MPCRFATALEMHRLISLSERFRPLACAVAFRVDDACRKQDCEVLIVYGRRTHVEQLELYRRGRAVVDPRKSELNAANWKRVGDVVTKALPGESPHNFGEAMDIALIGPDKRWLADADPRWAIIGRAAEAEGLVWGGHFQSLPKDCAHVEHPDWREAQAEWRRSGGGLVP